MSVSLHMNDATFRTLLFAALARSGEGLVACDDGDEVVFACPRGARLLERLGGRAAIAEWRAEGFDDGSRRIPLRDGAVHVTIGAAGSFTLLWLREEARRDDRLYAALHERYGLSRRTFQLALLVRQGLKNREIARELLLSEATVKVYLHHLYRACGVPSRTALVALMNRS